MAKRPNRSGTYIHDKKRSRWIFQYTVTDVYGNSKRRALYGRTRAELEARVARTTIGIEDITTLNEWINRWLSLYVEPAVKPNTYKFYQYLFAYVPSSILDSSLSKLKPIHFQQLFTELLRQGSKEDKALSTATIRHLRSTLISCLNVAVNNELLHKNPVLSTKPPRLVQQERISLSLEQMKRLLSVVDDGNYYINRSKADIGQEYQIRAYAVLIHLALASGMRRGEIFGLAWNQVDFQHNRVRVIRNLQYTEGKGFSLATPKTPASVRGISLDMDTMYRLKAFKEYQLWYAQNLGTKFQNPYDLVFTNIWGGFIRFDNFRQRQWKAMCKAACLPKEFTFHCLRHTMTTLMLQAGVNIKTISKRLGHTNSAFTIKVYAHVLDTMETEASDTWGEILRKD